MNLSFVMSLVCLATVCYAKKRPLIIAHTGSSGEMPDQALETLKQAVKDGADAIEFDLYVTKDLKLVVTHDLDLNKTTNVSRIFPKRSTTIQFETSAESLPFRAKNMTGFMVYDFDYAEIESLRKVQSMGYRDQSYNGKFRIPLFRDVLRQFKNESISLVVDIKYPDYQNKMIRALNSSNITIEDLVIDELAEFELHEKIPFEDGNTTEKYKVYLQSFEENCVRRLLELSELPCVLAQLNKMPNKTEISDWKSKGLYGFNLWKLAGTKVLPYSEAIKKTASDETKWKKFFNTIHDNGMKGFVFVFAENRFTSKSSKNNETEILMYTDYGADGLLTDFPLDMNGVLRGRASTLSFSFFKKLLLLVVSGLLLRS